MSYTEMGPGLDSDSYIFGKEREFARTMELGWVKEDSSELCINLIILPVYP